jgi:hypothetical protein
MKNQTIRNFFFLELLPPKRVVHEELVGDATRGGLQDQDEETADPLDGLKGMRGREEGRGEGWGA